MRWMETNCQPPSYQEARSAIHSLKVSATGAEEDDDDLLEVLMA